VRLGFYLPDGGLLFSLAAGGDENYQIYWAQKDDQVAQRMTDGKSRKPPREAGLGRTPLRLLLDGRNGRDADLYVFDLRVRSEPEMLLEVENETWNFEDWSEDGSKLLLSHFVSVSESYGYVMEFGSRNRKPLPAEPVSPKGETGARSPASRRRGRVKASRSSLRFGPRLASVYLVTDARASSASSHGSSSQTGRYLWAHRRLPWDVEDLEIALRSVQGRVSPSTRAGSRASSPRPRDHRK